ncbi:MAG: phosphoenolpyruvate synthase [Candidatus Micrarchaeia archaeon]|jgi:pyruvate,water dikinase
MKFVKFFDEINKKDILLAGGKGANLGEMKNAGLPVPNGFVVTAQAYKYTMEKNNLLKKIFDLIKELNVHDQKQLSKITQQIRKLIENVKIPEEVEKEIKKAYKTLSKGREVAVAVRSSATAEDIPSASFAGEQITLLNVKGEENVIKAIKKCWASLFTERATFYRSEKGFSHEKVLIAVPVQIQLGVLTEEEYLKGAYKSGIGFTIHPTTGEKDKIVIEASFGQGEEIVSGTITPDTYIIDKKTGKLIEKKLGSKEKMKITAKEGLKEIQTPFELRKKECLTQKEIKQLYKLAILLENHYNFPQDFEWASQNEKVYLLQTRPVTAFFEKKESELRINKKPLLHGLPASPGVGIGEAKIIISPKEGNKLKEGDVLVTKMTNPDFVPLMKKASAIVTDEGGMTSHAAIVSRELGVPCVVGTGNATKILKGIVTVDGREGFVYPGKIEELFAREKAYLVSPQEVKKLKTKTKILMNLGVPGEIEKYKELPFDGIGLMRVEFIIAEWVKEHPNYLIQKKQQEKYINKLAEGIEIVAKAVYPRFVVVRFSDFKTNEYRGLKGGEKFEPIEANPMIGWRGVSRYISKNFEEAFRLECKAIKKVRKKYDNVWVMLPFVRTTWEVERCLKIMEEEGLKRSKNFKVWLMAEVPSIVFLADKFSKLCDGFSIGSNDLTQLVLGVDRDSEILANMGYFDERDEAVKRAIKHLIEEAHKNKVSVSICGQAPSVYPEFTRFLVSIGIDSVSVNPDTVAQTKKLVYGIEKEIKA